MAGIKRYHEVEGGANFNLKLKSKRIERVIFQRAIPLGRVKVNRRSMDQEATLQMRILSVMWLARS